MYTVHLWEIPTSVACSFLQEGQINLSSSLHLSFCLQVCFKKSKPCASPLSPPKSCLRPCDDDSLSPNLLSFSFITFPLLISPFSLFLPHYFCQAASVTHSVTCLLPPFIPLSFLAKLLCFNTRQMLLKRGSPPSHSAFRFNSLPSCLSFTPSLQSCI